MNQYLRITLIFLLALGLRVGWAAFGGLYEPGLISDTSSAQAHEIAVSLSKGQGFQLGGKKTAQCPPVYPSFLAAIYYLVGVNIWFAKLAQALIGALTCLLIYFLAVDLYTLKVGNWAMFICAIFPGFIVNSALLNEATLFQFVTMVLMFYLTRLQEDFSPMRLLLCGLVLGITVLTSSIMVFLPVFLFFWYLAFHSERVMGIAIAMVMGLCMLLVILPWVTRNYLQLDSFVPLSSESGIALYGGNNEKVNQSFYTRGGWLKPEVKMRGLNESEVNLRYWRLTLDYWRDKPFESLAALPFKFFRFWSPWPAGKPLVYQILSLLSFAPVLALFLYYLSSSKAKEHDSLLPIFGLICYLTMLSLIVYGSERFRFPIEPLLIILATKSLIKEKLASTYPTRQKVVKNPDLQRIPVITTE